MKRILFLCTGNSARSQLAEVVLRVMGEDRFEVCSAGTAPETVDSRVYQVLSEQAIEPGELTSKAVTQAMLENSDLVISLCDDANQECRTLPDDISHLHWELDDPKSHTGLDAFRNTLAELQERIGLLVKFQGSATAATVVPNQFFKSLTDTTRLTILMLLQDEGELSVGELVEALQLSQPKISRHLAQLRQQGVLTDRRKGQWVFYGLNNELPTWAEHVIAATRIGNPALINKEKSRLKVMAERPSKAIA
ncbi:metalloregulator ArsR/SmtB family transcription factor [Corallincola platygyrae]|uniref:Metalloregulator ArsR/SmtB family transcription factor n=1 Tax=Corallincola platygyrae TaxID=1193278 RepID=A0ABW4XR49_9GAMM